MAEIGISIAAKVAEVLVAPTIRHGQYMFCPKKIIKNLEKAKGELALRRDSVEHDVEETRKKTYIINDEVQKWLEGVTSLMEKTQDLEQAMQANISCVREWCPSWRRYCQCKQMAEMIKMMTEFRDHSSMFKQISRLASLPGIDYISDENLTYFESTKGAYNQLLEAMKDDNTNMIGLYGMGGSGKTTLATEMGKKARELNLFDRVIFVAVSQTPDIRSIQGKMADQLSVKLEEESEEGRAQRLRLRLKHEKRVFIILDDIWRKLDLNEIGILLDLNNKGGCKVLLTTRRRRVCSLMECEREIQLELLSEEEGWSLFQKLVSIDDQSSSNLIYSVAREIARECRGLPIAIKAVGSSLKGIAGEFEVDEWKVALLKLKYSKPIDVDEGERDAFSCLKLSYDYLKNKEAEMLFLMCAMFPEDHEISIEELVRYAVGLDVCEGYETLDSARCRVRVGLNKLVESCLLMHSETSPSHFSKYSRDRVKMHDMVRDLALWIAPQKDCKILVNLAKGLSALAPENGAVSDCFAVSSWYKEENPISFQLNAPKLEILLLNPSKMDSLDLSLASCEGIEGLKVMTIMMFHYNCSSLSLPQSIQSLSNLRTLCLRGSDLGDISFVLSLRRLEVLDLQGCCFMGLPDGIQTLSKLKLLDLRNCKVLENYNPEVIGSCSQLEELYVSGSQTNIPQHFLDSVILLNLQRFELRHDELQELRFSIVLNINRRLALNRFNISNLVASKQNLIQRAEHVGLSGLKGGCRNIIPDMVRAVGGMNDLICLRLENCSEIECLIKTTFDHASSLQEDSLPPRLVNIQLSGMKNLVDLSYGPPDPRVLGFFEKLEELHIYGCKQLQRIFPRECKLLNLKILKIGSYPPFLETGCNAISLFSKSIAQSLRQLHELSIRFCKELRHIITNDGEDGTTTREEIVPAPHCSHLMFPKLEKLFVDNCSKLEFIFPISCVQDLVQLQEIKIFDCDVLKYVFGQYDPEGHSFQHKEIQIMLPLLKSFELNGLINLLGICPENYPLRCPSLKELHLLTCPKLTTPLNGAICGSVPREQHLDRGVTLVQDQQKHFSSKLECSIWSGLTPSRQIWSFQYLQILKVGRCNKFKFLFPTVNHTSLPELMSLGISGCEELEEIIGENEESHTLPVDHVCFPKLRDLEVHKCNKLESLFSIGMARMVPLLRTLNISEAAQLQCVFRHSIEDNIDNEYQIVLPELTEIRMEKVPKLVDICQGIKLQAMKLQKIRVEECPKLGTTEGIPPRGRTAMPMRNDGQVCTEASDLRAVAVVHTLSFSDIECLYLKHLSYLLFVWKGTTLPTFQNLQLLKVSGCRKLKSLFPAAVIISLAKLKFLRIDNCEELEEIISENAEAGKEGFPTLTHLWVIGCYKLKCLFPLCVAEDLPQLESLTIEMAFQLKQIFGCAREGETRHGKEAKMEIVFPKLKKLRLHGLPSLTNICGGSNFQLQSLEFYEVEHCPNFSATEVAALDNFRRKLLQTQNTGQIKEDHGDYKRLLEQEDYIYMYDTEEPNNGTGAGVNDFSIDIWPNPWVPSVYDKKNLISERGFNIHLVGDLFIHGTEVWDELKVRKVYKEQVADKILKVQVPVPSQSEPRFCCAHLMYQSSTSSFFHPQGKCRLLERHKQLWKRVLNDELPVKIHLERIFKSENSACLFCSQASETVDHLFLRCSFVRSLWFISPWAFRAHHFSNFTMEHWFQFLTDDTLVENSIGICPKQLLLYASVMMDKVWEERNRLAHATRDSDGPDMLAVANSISSAYYEAKAILQLKDQVTDHGNDSNMCLQGWYKAYFDAATIHQDTWAAAVLLDHEGKLTGARTKKLNTTIPMEAKALALEIVVELCCDIVPNSCICLEGDCVEVIKELLGEKPSWQKDWFFKPILVDVLEKLRCMSCWTAKSISKNFNLVAHNAVRWAASSKIEGNVLNSLLPIEVLSRKDDKDTSQEKPPKRSTRPRQFHQWQRDYEMEASSSAQMG